ncbi:MAG: transposase [Clostridium sp.]|nr:transposase [Clostridium sp.]
MICRAKRGNGGIVSHDDCFNNKQPFRVIEGRFLPHIEQPGKLSYITIRLGDSLPKERVEQLESELKLWLGNHPMDSWTRQESTDFFRLQRIFNKWLTAGYGECILQKEAAYQIVESALRYGDGTKYDLYEYVIMPNHIHMIIAAYEYGMNDIIGRFKSFTSHQINKFCGRAGSLWAQDYFDHMIRSVKSYEEISTYIIHNPDALNQFT